MDLPPKVHPLFAWGACGRHCPPLIPVSAFWCCFPSLTYHAGQVLAGVAGGRLLCDGDRVTGMPSSIQLDVSSMRKDGSARDLNRRV
jgi:hypothetical protein